MSFFELFQDYLPALYRFRKSQWSDRTEEHYLEDYALPDIPFD